MIKQFEYRGEKIPVRIGYYVQKMFKHETGHSFAEASGDDIEVFEILLYYGMIAGYKDRGEECPFKREDVEFILDAIFEEFTKAFPEMLGVNIEDVQDEVDKEKVESEEKKTPTRKKEGGKAKKPQA